MTELHVHLEGAVPIEAMAEIYRRHGHPELGNPQRVKEFIRFEGFADFLSRFKHFLTYMKAAEDYAFLTEAALTSLADDGIRDVELTISLGAASIFHGLDWTHVLEEIGRGYAAAHEATGIEMRILVDLIRNHGPEAGWKAVRFAAENRHLNIAGINLGGDEANYPAAPYAEIYAFGRDYGLGLTAHAGEAAGPESVWACVNLLKVDRIGHGTRASEDPALLETIAERGIVIEACPTSNVRTGAIASLADHPLRKFLDVGCRVCLNTDDPTFFRLRLSDEFRQCAETHRLSDDEVQSLHRVAREAAFTGRPVRST